MTKQNTAWLKESFGLKKKVGWKYIVLEWSNSARTLVNPANPVNPGQQYCDDGPGNHPHSA